MNCRFPSLISLIVLVSLTLRATAALTIPGAHNGTDGALNITVDTVIDLSQAVTGAYDQDNTANAGKGVYDAAQWAVVFKYSSVSIGAGATVTFKNHPSRAPVIWLVTGTVNIAGTVSLDGQNEQAVPLLAEPGPGGFRGGGGTFQSSPLASAGFGPGGGFQTVPNYNGNDGGAGSFGTAVDFGSSYGNPSLVPLIGGSGGAARPTVGPVAGAGAGGGAMLIASAGTVPVTGGIHATGGAGDSNFYISGAGSGGGIRIVCDTLAGTGMISAGGGGGGHIGGLGRIRLERVTNNNTLVISPDPSVVPLNAGDTAIVVPPAGAPTVRVVSIGAVNTPADPRAGFGSAGADVTLPETTSTQVVIETTNVEQASAVTVRLTPRSNANAQVITAAFTNQVSPGVLRWAATLPVNVGYSAVQVKVVRP
jgi:hypothetical protein